MNQFYAALSGDCHQPLPQKLAGNLTRLSKFGPAEPKEPPATHGSMATPTTYHNAEPPMKFRLGGSISMVLHSNKQPQRAQKRPTPPLQNVPKAPESAQTGRRSRKGPILGCVNPIRRAPIPSATPHFLWLPSLRIAELDPLTRAHYTAASPSRWVPK